MFSQRIIWNSASLPLQPTVMKVVVQNSELPFLQRKPRPSLLVGHLSKWSNYSDVNIILQLIPHFTSGSWPIQTLQAIRQGPSDGVALPQFDRTHDSPHDNVALLDVNIVTHLTVRHVVLSTLHLALPWPADSGGEDDGQQGYYVHVGYVRQCP